MPGPASGIPAHGLYEPFKPGHTLSTTHGATSERRLGPVRDAILKVARESPAWPPYLNDESYQHAVNAWARAEAVCVLVWSYLENQDIDAALTEKSSSAETEYDELKDGRKKHVKLTQGRRTAAALDYLDRFEKTAANHRSRLGLDPLSRARLGKDVTAARLDLAQIYAAEAGKDDTPPAPEQQQ